MAANWRNTEMTQDEMRRISAEVITTFAAGNELEALELAGTLPEYAQDQLIELIENFNNK